MAKVTDIASSAFILLVFSYLITGGFNTEILGILLGCVIGVVVIFLFLTMLSAFGRGMIALGVVLGAIQVAVVWWIS